MTRTGFARSFLGDPQAPVDSLTDLLRHPGWCVARTGVELEGGFVSPAAMGKLWRVAAPPSPKEFVE
jgi:hypothetical protein